MIIISSFSQFVNTYSYNFSYLCLLLKLSVLYNLYRDILGKEIIMNIDYKLIGERIKKARKAKGITQDVLAERLNVSIGYVSQVERGITKISLDLLGAISSILECDIASFITESATNSNEYMESEILSEILKLDGKKKKYILEIIKLTNNMT